MRKKERCEPNKKIIQEKEHKGEEGGRAEKKEESSQRGEERKKGRTRFFPHGSATATPSAKRPKCAPAHGSTSASAEQE
eukprot:3905755-Pyramimonas_sp.AAC.1